MKKSLFLVSLSIILFTHCQKARQESVSEDIFDRVRNLPDSIKINDITIYNLFKYQILAHRENSYDSTMVIEKVFERHPKIWKELYGVLFDSVRFSTEAGMISWNKDIYQDHLDTIESRIDQLLEVNFDSTLKASLTGLKRLTGRTPENVKLSIILSPVEGIGFGGMENDAFILDLLDSNFDVINMVEEGIPHELNHFIYEPTRANDPDKESPLRLCIDEGFACYYTYRYFDGGITKAQAVEQMSEAEWQWYLDHEKEIFEQCAPHFFQSGEDDPLRQLGKEMGAPKTLFYWLGFRIIEKYVQNHGKGSWKDIYELPIKDVLEQSNYAESLR
ncbi:DUF2268 domain-containing putative Zn-dependent protease [Echinicola sp. 20G]|uniref:DUF2268 domain-containing putative Zn-dependent protease n=1 Tax=Echinicola sp. 20G TaxID=2781961 RepID=UPI00191060B7|nr:DUF2268 domain-containing putative Zn-dependent protease [Echinicola sp. 20G]